MQESKRERSSYQCPIESRGENKLPVGRELDERNRRALIINQRLHTMPRPRVPNPTQAIVAAGDDERAVPVEINSRHGVGVRGQDAEALAGLDVPDADGLVEGSGGDHVRLRVEAAAEGVVGMSG